VEDKTHPPGVTGYKENRICWVTCRGHQISLFLNFERSRQSRTDVKKPQKSHKETSIKVFDEPYASSLGGSPESSS